MDQTSHSNFVTAVTVRFGYNYNRYPNKSGPTNRAPTSAAMGFVKPTSEGSEEAGQRERSSPLSNRSGGSFKGSPIGKERRLLQMVYLGQKPVTRVVMVEA